MYNRWTFNVLYITYYICFWFIYNLVLLIQLILMFIYNCLIQVIV